MQLLLHLRGIYCTFCTATFFLRALITVGTEVAKESKHSLLKQKDRYLCEKKDSAKCTSTDSTSLLK